MRIQTYTARLFDSPFALMQSRAKLLHLKRVESFLSHYRQIRLITFGHCRFGHGPRKLGHTLFAARLSFWLTN